MTNEWLLIFSENWRGYLSEKQMALHPEDTPRQDKDHYFSLSSHETWF